jgi:hypothetical protein
MLIPGLGCNTSAWSAGHKAVAHQEWLSYRFNGLHLFAHSDRKGGKTHWPTVKAIDESEQDGPIKAIEPLLIHLIDLQGA